jgi:hypothetical protein
LGVIKRDISRQTARTNTLEVGQQLEEGISVGTIVESEEGHLGS